MDIWVNLKEKRGYNKRLLQLFYFIASFILFYCSCRNICKKTLQVQSMVLAYNLIFFDETGYGFGWGLLWMG